ncbi:PBECR2 nuclease fold domain-containing protein [Alloalcanivorax xenomutans]
MPSASYGSVPFQEQIQFFQRKLNVPTNAWTDIYGQENDWAFMVAGANRDALVTDFREAVENAIANGGTLETFRRDFDDIVARHGWDYNGGREWRSRTIFETNLFSSYQAGRYQQLWENREALPYWQYNHSDAVEHPRELHLAWDGLVLPAGHPWWRTHFPINAWGCQCWVTGLAERDLTDLGKTGPDEAPTIEWEERVIGQYSPDGPRTVRVPAGIDPGFEHAPGRSRLDSAVPPERPDPPLPGSVGGEGLPNRRPSDPLPAPRHAPASRLLPGGLTDEEYAGAFLDEFGASLDEPRVVRDVIGEPLVVGRDLFEQRRTGRLKADKRGRGRYMRILADAVLSPDEIWVRVEYQAARKTAVVRRRYIAQFLLPGEDVPALAVFEWSESGWSGITTFALESGSLDDLRVGVRLYRREE